jgi:uncharacterized protein
MRRFMVHLQNKSQSPKSAAELLYRARNLIGKDGLVVRDARVSKKYIEYDLSLPDDINAKDVIEDLAVISPVATFEEVTERHIPKDEAINLAVESFNDEKYWNAHELLEGVWKKTSGGEKSVLNGIILVAAAFVHDEKDEPEICISILRRALVKLENGLNTYHGVDIDRLANKVAEIINTNRVERFTI